MSSLPGKSLKTLGVERRLLLNLSLFLLMGVLLAVTSLYYLGNSRDLNGLMEHADRVYRLGQQAQLAERNLQLEAPTQPAFMENGASAELDSVTHYLRQLNSGLDRLAQEPLLQSSHAQRALRDCHNDAQQYQEMVLKLAATLRQRGFKDFGLEGKMRNQIHQLESVDIDPTRLLRLRRLEKDFLLRKDPAYALTLNEEADRFTEELAGQGRANEARLLSQYKTLFNEILAAETQLGLDADKGLRAQLRNRATLLNQNLTRVRQQVLVEINEAGANMKYLFGLFLSLMAGMAVFLTVFITRRVARPIRLLSQAVEAKESGERDYHPYLERIGTRDEPGALAQAFGRLLEEQDRLLVEQQAQTAELKSLLDQNEQRAWRHEGLQRLNGVLNEHRTNQQALATQWLSQLVPYLKAGQATLFVATQTDVGETMLVQQGTYAWNKAQRSPDTLRQLHPGEGLVGQCFQEKESRLLKKIPADYIQITSGLGAALPQTLALVPCIFDQQVYAVVELASFQELTHYQIAFVEQAGGQLAAKLAAFRQEEITRQLLRQAQDLSDRLLNQPEW